MSKLSDTTPEELTTLLIEVVTEEVKRYGVFGALETFATIIESCEQPSEREAQAIGRMIRAIRGGR